MSNFSFIEYLLPTSVVIEKDLPGQPLFVKGFVSAEGMDSHGDMVEPTGFDLEQTSAEELPLLIEHQAHRVVGRPRELFVAELKDISSTDQWAVIDLETGQQRNTIPREAVPNLKAGSRGVFGVVEVTDQDAADDVREGVLRAFSWRGKVIAKRVADAAGRFARRLVDYVEMLEVSLVRVPANANATTVIGKSAGDQEVNNQLHRKLAAVKHTVDNLMQLVAELQQQHDQQVAAVRGDTSTKSNDPNAVFDGLFGMGKLPAPQLFTE